MERVLQLWFTGRLANCKWLWQCTLYYLIGHFDTVHTRCRRSMMAPADERCDCRIIALSHRLNATVGPVGHPATETEPPRGGDRRGAKRDSLDTSYDVQPFAYDHRISPRLRRRRGSAASSGHFHFRPTPSLTGTLPAAMRRKYGKARVSASQDREKGNFRSDQRCDLSRIVNTGYPGHVIEIWIETD